MKICPKCRKTFSDELNYCLDDGTNLKDEIGFSPENTLSSTDQATLRYRFPPTAGQNARTNETNFGKPKRSSRGKAIVFGAAAVFLLFAGALGGGLLYLRQIAGGGDSVDPSPTPSIRTIPAYSISPTPQKSDVKVEILEKVKNLEGTPYLKCRLTNNGAATVYPYTIKLLFYKGDVQIKDNAAFVLPDYIKAGESVPVWVGLYNTEGYTSVKVSEPITGFQVNKPDSQIFAELSVSETDMKKVYGTSYQVSGIAENRNYPKTSFELFIIFYDENNEIVGFAKKRLTDLEKDIKTKFDTSVSQSDLFGKPVRFETIAYFD